MKHLLLSFLIILAISACQNSSISPKGISSSTKKAIDTKEPLTVIGGDLTYEFINQIQSNHKLYGVKFNPKNSTIITYGDSDKIDIYSMNLKYITSLSSKNDEINSIDTTPNGDFLVSGGDDGYVEIWDLNSYKLIHRLQSSSKDIFAVAFSADGKKVASGGAEKVIDIWDRVSGEQLARLEGHQGSITNLAFIDFNRKIVSTAKDKQTKIWDVNKKELFMVISLHLMSMVKLKKLNLLMIILLVH